MARKSGWQQFADNFTSMYSTVNKFSEEGDIRDINERSIEEQFDDTGAVTGFKYGNTLYNTLDDTGGLMRPSDAQLQSQDFKDMQQVMSKHGNWKEAQEMGLGRAKLEAQEEANRLARETHQFNVDQAAANLTSTTLKNTGLGDTNKVNKAVGEVTISQAEMDAQHNKWLIEYSTKEPEEGKKFLDEKCKSTAGNSVFCDTIKATNAFELHKKANVGAQLMASVQAALGKGQAGGQEELMALIDAQDGITGNIRFDTDESGAVSIVELDQKGNPTNAAPWAGKNWEDFSQNVMKRLDPVNAISITSKQVGVEKDEASVGLLNAQTLEALQKASGSGNSEKMAAIKLKAVTDFENNEAGLYQQALRKGDRKKAAAILDSFKYEMNNFDKRRNNEGGYNQPKPVPGAGDDGLNLTNALTRTADGAPVGGAVTTAPPVGEVTPTPTSGISNKNSDAVPETKKVLTKANIAEIAALDNEVTDIKAKVVELSKVRGLQSGGKARNEIQKLRKRLVGIEQRKYKIQN